MGTVTRASFVAARNMEPVSAGIIPKNTTTANARGISCLIAFMAMAGWKEGTVDPMRGIG